MTTQTPPQPRFGATLILFDDLNRGFSVRRIANAHKAYASEFAKTGTAEDMIFIGREHARTGPRVVVRAIAELMVGNRHVDLRKRALLPETWDHFFKRVLKQARKMAKNPAAPSPQSGYPFI